jgi:hypothetical protein
MAKMTREEMLELLKDEEFVSLMKETKDPNEELKDLLKPLEITEDTSVEDLSRKQGEQLQKVVAFFQKQVTSAEERAVDRATKGERERSQREIVEFAKTHPGMNSDEVVKRMQPLYDEGKPLDECYSFVCRGLNLNPQTGIEAGTDEDKAKMEELGLKTEEKEEKTLPPNSSVKSNLAVADDDDAGGPPKKDDEPVSLEDAISANMNALDAKNGCPFE